MLAIKHKILSLIDLSTFRQSARLLNRIFSPSKPRLIEIDGLSLHAKTLDRILALHLLKWKLNESGETKFFTNLIRPGMCVIDVGANLGYYAFLAARKVGREGIVYAFEPDPENCLLLDQSIRANGFYNVRLVQKAVSDVSGSGTLFFSGEHRGDHRIIDPGTERTKISIETTRLDDAIPEEQRVDVVKMDIQGAEMQALKGMRRILAQNPQMQIICEFWPKGLALGGSSAEEFLSFTTDLGYDIFFLTKQGQPISAHASEITRMCGSNGYINLYLTR